MALRVPRRPETSVATRQQGYAQPVPGLDLSPITQSIDQLRAKLDEDRRAKQKFDLNRRMMDEVNALQADFEARKRDPSIGLDIFAESTNAAYEERHRALVDTAWQEGYDEDLLNDFDSRLGTIRQGFFGNALGHQVGQLRVRAEDELDQYGVAASQLATSNPGAWPSVEEDIRETVMVNPYLTEAEKIAKVDELVGVARQGAGKAFALQSPDEVIRLLDPQGFTAPPSAVGAGAGYTINTQGLDADRGTVASTLASQLPAPVVAGFLGNFDVEGGYGSAQGDGGTASGIAQWRHDRRDNFRAQFGVDPHQATKEQQAQFVLWEMQNPAAAGMTVEQRDAILAAGTPEEAAELIDRYYERSSGEHRSRRKENAARYGMIATIDPGAGSVPEAPRVEVPETEQATTLADVQTGVPILDALNGPERLQVLSWAREQQNRQIASQKAAMDVVIGNITAEAMNNGGEIATPIPREEDVISAYGPIEGPQRWAQIQRSVSTGKAIETFRMMSGNAIADSLAMLEPEPGTPTYETELQIYQAAERAAAALAEERERDPAAYAMKYFPSLGEAAEKGTAEYYAELDRVYSQLGIDPDYAPVLPSNAMERVVQDYKVMAPAQRKQYIQQNFSAMGEDRFRRFTQGMEGTTAQDDARIYALMRNYRGAPGEWDNVFTQVLEGREMIQQDPAKRPNAMALREQFRSQAFAAINNLNPAASRSIQEAAVALYVFRGGNPTEIDTKLYTEALTTALGGSPPFDDTKGEVTDFTILPPKVTATQFDNWRDRLTPGSLTALSVERTPPLYADLRTPATMEDIQSEGVFVMTSPGRYMIKMGSDGKPLLTRSGRPFIVNVDTRTVRQ